MKILLTGAKGQLGSECKEVMKSDYEVIDTDLEEFDITSWDNVILTISQLSPDIILNCAAFTNVDECETKRRESERINVEGPRNLAQGAARYEKVIVHISSDFVFNGRKRLPQPYFEDDPMSPLSFYGVTKMESETAVKQNALNYILIRTGWLYGIRGDNFIKRILALALQKDQESLRVVNDQFGSPTWSYRLAQQIKVLIDKGKEGVYHATSEGYCSRYEWVQYILERMDIKIPVFPCTSDEYPTPAKRPANSILENRQLKTEGLNIMPSWQKDLDTFLDTYGETLVKDAEGYPA
ncbi:MAG: dTDP-4-dehydrorhamnose reductase [Deltaproteobacteria bacterium]|nr:dTDP-4-dehydrorhamnose reductase [Deltaproteobacteria bacterium]MBW2312095.1 dTDP-4-dehydrorhamnose reductase [Deltaproteobacteria bacterium]